MLDRKVIVGAQPRPRSGGDVALFAMVFVVAVMVFGAGVWVYVSANGGAPVMALMK